jgi:hypothetical protein
MPFLPSSRVIQERAGTTDLVAQLAGKAAATHNQAISTITGLQAALDGKADEAHTHGLGDVTGLVDALINIGDEIDGKAASAHDQAISTITGLQAALDGKAASAHDQAISTITGLQAALDGKAASAHDQAISTITGLQAVLDGKAASASLGTAATRDVPESGNAASGQIVLGSDTRLIGLSQFPIAGTGSVYASTAGAGLNNFTLSRNIEYASGIYIATELSVATMRLVLQVSSAGTVARLAIKPIIQSGANRGKPGNPVWTSGECDFAVTGEKDTAVGVTLAPGWYALCAAFFNGSANPQFMAGNVAGSYPVWGRTLGVAAGQPINLIYRTGATNASLPDTTTSTWVNNPGSGVPIIGLIPS